MEISLTDGEGLRISLTPFDMIHYELTNDSIDYGDTRTRRVLWEIFDKAKEQTGFDAANGKIKISVYPQKNGGCLIYITRPDSGEEAHTDRMNQTKERPGLLRDTLYVFSRMDDMIRACSVLDAGGYSGNSSAYSCDGSYYLTVTETGEIKSPSFLPENMFMYEFGSKCADEYTLYYIKEHGICFCEKNAVKTLAQLSDGDV